MHSDSAVVGIQFTGTGKSRHGLEEGALVQEDGSDTSNTQCIRTIETEYIEVLDLCLFEFSLDVEALNGGREEMGGNAVILPREAAAGRGGIEAISLSPSATEIEGRLRMLSSNAGGGMSSGSSSASYSVSISGGG